MRIIAALCALSLTLLVSACGGSSDGGSADNGDSAAASSGSATSKSPGTAQSEEEAVKEAIRTYGAALAEGDGEVACGSLTEEIQRDITSRVATELKSIDSCEEAMRVIATKLTPEQVENLPHPAFKSVTVSGQEASVKVKGGNGTQRLTKASGRWVISDLS